MRLVIFDVDGTLVDSQHEIVSAMSAALTSADLPVLSRAEVLSIVGLSLPLAVARLIPEASPAQQEAVVDGYRLAYQQARLAGARAPLYAGAMDCLERLSVRDDILLAIATGKSRRGLSALLEAEGLQGRFVSLQTADDHPSKPHPAMLEAAMSEAGVNAARAVMIGDTSFDMEMARAARAHALGVGWGYHPVDVLGRSGAAAIATDFNELTRMIEEWAA